MSFNLATILRESALANPEHPLLRIGTLELSYQQVDVMSGRMASGLLTAGLDRSDTVAVGEIVIRGGFNVYPREIEEVLHEHPSVLEAAVIGRPDDRLGEEVVAFIALKKGATATPDDVIDFCKERLAAYKYPREVVVLDELPKGGSGKVLKTELRASL
jgi:acyl-CoA synthetase (AMP-forming)/AMP-acid ligase II